MASLTDPGKVKKSRLADPTLCNGFSSVDGTRRTQRLSLFWDIQASKHYRSWTDCRSLGLSENADSAGEARDRSAFAKGSGAVRRSFNGDGSEARKRRASDGVGVWGRRHGRQRASKAKRATRPERGDEAPSE
jgi:hypothetical protein